MVSYFKRVNLQILTIILYNHKKMNPERSRSRERMQNPNMEKQQQQMNNQQQNRKYEMGNYQRGPSNQRRPHQRSSSNPPEFPLPQTFPAANQPNQYRKSSSPNRMMQPQSMLPVYPNPQQQNIYPNPIQRVQPITMKQPSMGKIDKIEDLATWLRSAKKPFTPSEAMNLQIVLQRLAPKYPFEKIYQTYVYFFIHSSTQDQNLYKVFYALISANIKAEGLGQDYLPRFYETLIRATLKSTFEQFKGRVDEIETLRVEEYFRLKQMLRERIVNKSLYQVGQSPIGCTIRNTLTLIRKAMQRQKQSDKSLESIHPIRQILKVVKKITRSILDKILSQQLTKKQRIKLREQQKERQNVFEMILISQLWLIVHFKYRHHNNAQFEETLNEMTIMKMNMTEVEQQIRSKLSNKSKSLSMADNSSIATHKQGQEQILKKMRINLENVKKEHNKNYLYLLFVLNLSEYYKSESQQQDLNLFWFYAKPFVQEYSRSSDFLSQKIQQNYGNLDKHQLFSNIVKNFGIWHKVTTISIPERQAALNRFIASSISSILLKCIKYAAEHITNTSTQSHLLTKNHFLTLFNALSPTATTFSTIHKSHQIKQQVQAFRNPGLLINDQPPNKYLEQREVHYVDKEFSYLIDGELGSLRGAVGSIQKDVLEFMTNKAVRYKIMFQPYKAKFQPKKEEKVTNNKQVVDLEIEQPQKQNKKTKQLTNLRHWLASLSLSLQSQSYLSLLGLVYMLFKQNKWQYAYKCLPKLNKLIQQIKLKHTESTDPLIPEEDEKSNLNGLKHTLKESIDKLVQQVHNLNQTQTLIIKLIQQQLLKPTQQNRNTSHMARIIKLITTNKQTKHIKLSSLPPCSILSIVVYQLVSQQQLQSGKLKELIKKYQTANKITHPQNQQGNKIIEEKDQIAVQDFNITSQVDSISRQVNSISSQVDRNSPVDSISSLVDNAIDDLIQNIKKYIQLTHKSIYQQQSLTHISSKLIDKKRHLLKHQLLTIQLPQLLNQIKTIHETPTNTEAQSIKQVVLTQSLVQKLCLSLFDLRKECRQSFGLLMVKEENKPQNEHNQNQLNDQLKHNKRKGELKAYSTRDIADSFGIKPFLDQLNNKRTPSYLFDLFIQQTQLLLSSLLQVIYSKFLSKSSPSQQPSSQNPSILPLIPLQQILVQKLKKSISLYYDKINQHMIYQFLINKELFILRVLVITFYKIKALCQAVVAKFGVFQEGLGRANQKSLEMRLFVDRVFFNIGDKRLVQPYVMFLMTKDKYYLKAKLIQFTNEKHQSTNQQQQIQHLIQIL